MRTARIFGLLIIALLVLCFGLATYLDGWFDGWQGNQDQSNQLLGVLLGDGKRMFADAFYRKADAYFHSGYYPSIFDNREAFQTPHVAEDSGTVAGHNQGDEEGFLGPPLDWIDRFSRKFFPSEHTHLDAGGAKAEGSGTLASGSDIREILPWLKLSSELDPNRIDTYTAAAYWLRQRMGKADEAEAFLREGLRANPNSYEILYELGRVYAESKKEPQRAQNLWEAALREWLKQEPGKKDPNYFLFIQIVSHLATAEESQGHYAQALAYMEMWKAHSPNPEGVEQLIQDVRKKAAAAAAPSSVQSTNQVQPNPATH